MPWPHIYKGEGWICFYLLYLAVTVADSRTSRPCARACVRASGRQSQTRRPADTRTRTHRQETHRRKAAKMRKKGRKGWWQGSREERRKKGHCPRGSDGGGGGGLKDLLTTNLARRPSFRGRLTTITRWWPPIFHRPPSLPPPALSPLRPFSRLFDQSAANLGSTPPTLPYYVASSSPVGTNSAHQVSIGDAFCLRVLRPLLSRGLGLAISLPSAAPVSKPALYLDIRCLPTHQRSGHSTYLQHAGWVSAGGGGASQVVAHPGGSHDLVLSND
jgi:hypothetical protein